MYTNGRIPESVFWIGVTILFLDYEYSLWRLPEGSSEREKVKHEVHLRSARRIQELCFKNGGIYIKLGQHISQLVCLLSTYQSMWWKKMGLQSLLYLTPSLMQEYLVPQEYVQIMREYMLNKCPVSPYDQVCEVFKKELGETPDKVYFLG